MNTSKLTYVLTVVLVAFLSLTAAAQDYTFKVISKKGVAAVAGEELKVGSKIQAGQSIVVGEGALLNIAHSNGKSLNISKPGTYKVDDLAKGCTADGGSLTGKYADFVLKELTSGDDSQVRGSNMRKPGSVERAYGDEFPIMFLSNNPDVNKTEAIGATTVTLRCVLNESESGKQKLDPESVTQYTFVIANLMGVELARLDSEEPKIDIDLSAEPYASAPGNTIKYHVYVNGDESIHSAPYVLALKKGAEAQSLAQAVAELSADNSAIGKLILARYLEDQGLHANALAAFEEAIQLSNEDEQFQQMYQAFLDRNYGQKKANKSGNQ